MQHQLGNRAIQHYLAQRRGGGGTFELDEETASRIQRARGSGQALDGAVGEQMQVATGFDFGSVRVHTDPEAVDLNRQVNAVAFTTGQDIFFSPGAYQPGSSSGRELLAHELTHVVQQSSGEVSGGNGRMIVNAPGDAYEQEADAMAKATFSTNEQPGVQRQDDEELEI